MDDKKVTLVTLALRQAQTHLLVLMGNSPNSTDLNATWECIERALTELDPQ